MFVREGLGNPEAPGSWEISGAAQGEPGFGFDPDVLDLNFCAVAGKRAQNRAGVWCHPRIPAAAASELEWRGRTSGGGGRLLPCPNEDRPLASRASPFPDPPFPRSPCDPGKSGCAPHARRPGSPGGGAPSGRGVRAPPPWVWPRGGGGVPPVRARAGGGCTGVRDVTGIGYTTL